MQQLITCVLISLVGTNVELHDNWGHLTVEKLTVHELTKKAFLAT
jgi:hypothetical protein